MVHERGRWLEVVTLVVPGFNDSDTNCATLRGSSSRSTATFPGMSRRFIRLQNDRPACHRHAATHPRAEMGVEEGLRFVTPQRTGTRRFVGKHVLPELPELLVERTGYLIRNYQLTGGGRCPKCRAAISGIWPTGGAAIVRTGDSTMDYHQRMPRTSEAELKSEFRMTNLFRRSSSNVRPRRSRDSSTPTTPSSCDAWLKLFA